MESARRKLYEKFFGGGKGAGDSTDAAAPAADAGGADKANAFYQPGEVWRFDDGSPVPESTLAAAFRDAEHDPADAIVLRGYLGRSDIRQRVLAYLERAKAAGDAKGNDTADIQDLIKKMNEVGARAEPHVPLRLFLTPSLDRWVDFHRSSVIAMRREPRTERRDMFTVWLRIFQTDASGALVPIPYRVTQQTNIGPAFGAYLGGDLVDDYLDQSSSFSSAWGDQTAVYGGYRQGTGKTCLGS